MDTKATAAMDSDDTTTVENGQNGLKNAVTVVTLAGTEENDDQGASWMTREEAARAMGKTVRTVDRLRQRGVLADLPGGGAVRVTTESVEALLRRKVAPRPSVAMTTVEAEHYDALLLQLQRKTVQIEEMSGRLLTWEGDRAAAAARIAELEAAAAAAAAEKERLAAELEAERGKGFFRRLFGR